MKLSEHPVIRSLGNTSEDLLPFFSPADRVIIQICREIIGENDEN